MLTEDERAWLRLQRAEDALQRKLQDCRTQKLMIKSNLMHAHGVRGLRDFALTNLIKIGA